MGGVGTLGGLPPPGTGTGGRRKSRGPREQPGDLTEFRLRAVCTFIIILSDFPARELMATAVTARGAWGTCAWSRRDPGGHHAPSSPVGALGSRDPPAFGTRQGPPSA